MIDLNMCTRPFTSKKYLQAPFGGYFYTLWPDLKVLGSKFELKSQPEKGTWHKYPATGMRFLIGEEMRSFDFKTSIQSKRKDGVPIHFVETREDGLLCKLESFCNTGVIDNTALTYFKIKNDTNLRKKGVIGLIARSGAENYLTGMEVDGYVSYNSNVGNWGLLQNTWSFDGKDTLTDSEYEIKITKKKGFKLKWQEGKPKQLWHQRHLLRLEYNLEPDEEAYIYLNLYPIGANEVEDYEKEKEKCEAFWHKQLDRITHMPKSKDYEHIVNNLAMQELQFFNTFKDEGFVAPRQGGMNRNTWSSEANEMICALDTIGDFNEYTTTACDYFFNHQQVKDGPSKGEIVIRTAWASSTGCACRIVGFHMAHTNKEEFDKYKEQAYLAFKWMEKMRAKSYTDGSYGKGIFPSGKGTDWPGEFQCWCVTDGHNLTGYKCLAEAFEKYKDKRAKEIRDAYKDYLKNMKRILKEEFKKNDNPDEFLVSNRLGIKQTDPAMGAYFGDGPSMLLMGGVMDPKSKECYMAEQYYINRGCMKNGLTGLMNDGWLRPQRTHDKWAEHQWYLSTCDSRWFYCYLDRGELSKAKDTLEATFYYGMSNEYYMPERMADNDPYFAPWQPNASANGRAILMLCRYFGTR